jgi:glycosyltransferase involved in cell wall biosynthesis
MMTYPHPIDKSTPLFTVIVPTHDRPSQLARCLGALAEQDFPRDRFEVIVVNDGGTAPLGPIYEAFCSRLSLILLSQNQAGPSAARNTGAAQAKGPYLAFTDDDCVPARDWLSRMKERLRTKPDQLYGGRTLNGVPDNWYAVASHSVLDVVYAWQEGATAQFRFFGAANLALAAKLFREVGGFRDSFRVAEDREFCDRWAHQGRPMTYAPEAMVYHERRLTLRGLWRQHFGYGRGSFLFHQLRAQKGWGSLRPSLEFYERLFRHAYNRPLPDRTICVGLLGIIQLANLAGFAWEAIVAREPKI